MAVLLLAASGAGQFESFGGHGNGFQVVPPAPSFVSVSATILTDGARYVLAGNAEGLIIGPVDVRIGDPGTNGTLLTTVQPTNHGAFLNSTFAQSLALTPTERAALERGEIYVEAVTARGKVRAQILPQGSKQAQTLVQSREVVPPVSFGAFGSGTFELIAGKNLLVYRVYLANFSASSASIFQGPVGTNGTKIADLRGGGQFFAGILQLTEQTFQAACNDGLYLLLATPQNPQGEARGQILAGQTDFVSIMGVGFDGGTGSAVARVVESVNGLLYAQVSVSGITPTSVEMRDGLPGAGGRLLFSCVPIAPGLYQGSTPLPLTPVELAALRSLQMHVLVRAPSGDLEGQIAMPSLPGALSDGCPGSDGSVGRGSFSYLPMPGAPARVDLLGATPNRAGALFFGSQLYPLPVQLSAIGATGCVSFVAPIVTLPMATNGFGYFELEIPWPNNHVLVAADVFGEFVLLDPGANPAGITVSNAFYDGAFGT